MLDLQPKVRTASRVDVHAAVPTRPPEQWVGVTLYTCRCMDLLLFTVPRIVVVITGALVLLRFFALGGIKRLELLVSD